MVSTTKNLLWVALDKFGNYAASLLIGIILARLLGPEVFGIVGIILVFMSIANIMATAGLRDAMIRKKMPDQNDYATMQLVNLIISICVYLIIYLTAPLLAVFFDLPELASLLRVYCLVIIIQSFAFTKGIRLVKAYRFRRIAIISMLSTFVAGIIAVGMAFAGYGVWSLVAQGLINWTLRVILYFIFEAGFTLRFSKKSFLEMWNFGSKMFVVEITAEIFQNINRAFIGKVFSASALGLFSKAETYKDVFSKNISFTFISVYFPMLSDIQDHPVRLKEQYIKMMKNLTFIVFVAMFTLMGSANTFIIVLIGEEWIEAVDILRILCIAGLAKPITSLNTNLLKVMGRSDIILKNQVAIIIFTTCNLFIAYFFGLHSLVIGIGVYSIIMVYITSRYSNIFIQYAIGKQIEDVLPNIVIGVCILIVTGTLDLFLTPSIPVLATQFLLVAFILLTAAHFFPNSISAQVRKTGIQFLKQVYK